MKFRRILALTAVAAGCLYAVFLGVLYFTQGSILFPGTKDRVESVPPMTGGSEVLRILTSQGNVDAIFMPATAGADISHYQNLPIVIS